MMTLDHIGYLTDNLTVTRDALMQLGYTPCGEPVADDTQRCHIAFVLREGGERVELVQPYDDNRTMQRMLRKQGCGPYHLCFAVDNIEGEVSRLTADGWLPLFAPVAAPAFGGHRICYLFRSEVGYIELVEK